MFIVVTFVRCAIFSIAVIVVITVTVDIVSYYLISKYSDIK